MDSNVKINLAKTAGFCFGVRRAIKMALKTSRTNTDVQMLGDIVHNEHVVKEINEAGIRVAESMEAIQGGTLLLRAHGAVPEVYEKAQAKNLRVVDATCPLVTEIHKAARDLELEGYRLVVIGDHNHDEVIGICAQVKDAVVFAHPSEVTSFNDRFRKVGVVVQSTQDIDNVRQIVFELLLKCQEMKFINTICKPTTDHQEEIRRMPQENDVMIIVGSFTSANTKRLTEISRELNPRTYQVQSAEGIQGAWLTGAKNIGVSAGASTPDRIIDSVVERIRQLITPATIG
jgi:4-hydroxy-3-methylbut-2-en-1-yl diphosphate reductase